jgi:hypothetical protein
MLLYLTDRTQFSLGAVAYRLPQGGTDATRITIGLEIEENMTEAIIDTGAPYLICSPSLSKLFTPDPAKLMYAKKLLIRGVWVAGTIYRINLSLLPDEGEALMIEAPAFIPDPDQEFTEGFLPRSFLGMFGCLEMIRFALDPLTETFYYG